MTLSNGGKLEVQIANQIQEIAQDLGGVLTYADLLNLCPLEPERKIQRIIQRLVLAKTLFKVKRGIYATSKVDLWILAARLCPRGYISTDNVLAKNLLIGTIPSRRIIILSPQKKKIYRTLWGSIYALQIKKELMFGFRRYEKGVLIADNEKAFLDLLYFYQRKVGFVVDPYEGIDIDKLNKKKIYQYLKKYQDKKTKNLVERIINGST